MNKYCRSRCISCTSNYSWIIISSNYSWIIISFYSFNPGRYQDDRLTAVFFSFLNFMHFWFFLQFFTFFVSFFVFVIFVVVFHSFQNCTYKYSSFLNCCNHNRNLQYNVLYTPILLITCNYAHNSHFRRYPFPYYNSRVLKYFPPGGHSDTNGPKKKMNQKYMREKKSIK